MRGAGRDIAPGGCGRCAHGLSRWIGELGGAIGACARGLELDGRDERARWFRLFGFVLSKFKEKIGIVSMVTLSLGSIGYGTWEG